MEIADAIHYEKFFVNFHSRCVFRRSIGFMENGGNAWKTFERVIEGIPFL
jgi:hypothetical protein